MVAHSSKKGKGDTKVLVSNDGADDVRGTRSKCPIATSLIFNFLMLLMLFGAGYYLCRYRRQICDMQVEHVVQNLDAQGVEYEIKGCEVYPVGDTAGITAQDQGILEIADMETQTPSGHQDRSPRHRHAGRHHRNYHHRDQEEA